MKRLKITIKGEGISVKTSDLGMGLSVLNRMVNHGINKHSWVPNALLDRANKVLDAAIKGQEFAKDILKKAKENYKQPEFAPAEEVADEQPKQLPKGKHSSPEMVNQWTLDEDKTICDMLALGVPVKKAKKDKGLRKKHTPHAIGTRYSIYKNQRFERLNKDRADMMRAYISGKKVKTSVANIRKVKQPATPIVDAMEKKVAKGYEGKPYKKPLKSHPNAWTERELNVIRENPALTAKEIADLLPGRTDKAISVVRSRYNMPVNVKRRPGRKGSKNIQGMLKANGVEEWSEAEEKVIIDNQDSKGKQLMKLLPGRSYAAIMAKRNQLSRRGLITRKGKSSIGWKKDEIEAIKLNMHMKPAELKQLPWLKDRTIGSISMMKSKIKNSKYEA